MNYILLIHQGDSPTPQSPEDWARLSKEEQKAVCVDLIEVRPIAEW